MAFTKFYTKRLFKGVTSKCIFRRNFDQEHGYKNSHTSMASFCVKLPEHLAEEMAAEGWRIGWTKVHPDAKEGTVPEPFIKVNIYTTDDPDQAWRNPVVNELVNGKVLKMEPKEIQRLQRTNIDKISLQIRPNCSSDDFPTNGATAYLVQMNVYPLVSELDEEIEEYRDSYEKASEEDQEEEFPF